MANILLIEDDKFLRELVVRKLTSEGFKVEEAEDGEMGIEKAKTTDPDLILLDIMLPKKDGLEVLRLICQDEAFRDVPVVVLSNLGERENVKTCLELGAKDYLIKAQFTPSEILTKVRSYLSA